MNKQWYEMTPEDNELWEKQRVFMGKHNGEFKILRAVLSTIQIIIVFPFGIIQVLNAFLAEPILNRASDLRHEIIDQYTDIRMKYSKEESND